MAGASVWKAERVGFEPTVRTSPTPVFETGPFNRSGTSPVVQAATRVRAEAAVAGGHDSSFGGWGKAVHLHAGPPRNRPPAQARASSCGLWAAMSFACTSCGACSSWLCSMVKLPAPAVMLFSVLA